MSVHLAERWLRHPFRRKESVVPVFVPGSMLPSLEDRVAQLEALGQFVDAVLPAVHVTIDPHFVPRACGRCPSDRPEVTSVRVYGNRVVEVCHGHAVALAPVGAVRQAQLEATAPGEEIRIEVCE